MFSRLSLRRELCSVQYVYIVRGAPTICANTVLVFGELSEAFGKPHGPCYPRFATSIRQRDLSLLCPQETVCPISRLKPYNVDSSNEIKLLLVLRSTQGLLSFHFPLHHGSGLGCFPGETQSDLHPRYMVKAMRKPLLFSLKLSCSTV